MLELLDVLRCQSLTTTFLTLAFLLTLGSTIYLLIKDAKTIGSPLNPARPPLSEKPTKPGYVTVFPPVQREVLAEIAPHISTNGTTTLDLSINNNPVLRFDADYRLAEPRIYNFSGYSVGEIKALGDFPDYAKLSGVPLPQPLYNFDIDKAVARPYRPLRWGYHQTMSLSKMEPDFWIELEHNYRRRLLQRQELYAQRGSAMLHSMPGSELACKELMEMVLQFICARYPNQFKMEGNTLVNNILGTRTDVANNQPLNVLLNNVPEDFGIMLRNPETGLYHLRAGMIFSTVGWSLSDKMGLGLPEIHRIVPDYKEKMEFSMDRFFTKMPTFKPVQRGSWGLENGEHVHLPAHDPQMKARTHQDPTLQPEDIFFRVDWQTLRRLPLSGAIVFNFKALFTPLCEFRDEPHIPSLILKIINEAKQNLLEYKGTFHVEHVVKPTLEEYERWQIEQGLIPKDWEHQTLQESPFFPGWERKWRDQ